MVRVQEFYRSKETNLMMRKVIYRFKDKQKIEYGVFDPISHQWIQGTADQWQPILKEAE